MYVGRGIREKNMYVRRGGLMQYLYIKNRSENHKYVCKEGGPTRNYKMGRGVQKIYIYIYVRRGCQKFIPLYFFFGIALKI